MVQVSNYAVKEKKDGTTFLTLQLTGSVELVQSTNTGKFYATVRKCSIPATFDEAVAKQLIGTTMPGKIVRVECEPYDYTTSNGEVIKLAHSYEYVPVEAATVDSKVEAEFA